MSTTKIILGVLGGVAVGALAGILLAPDKGTKTRKRILQKGNDYSNELKNKFEDLYNNAANKYDGAVDKAKELATDHQVK
ncbi:YtxH domain-containing protein [Flavobacterium sp. 102]|uniref:YtxH domain-containing protein n=1 Tax=Flavobacterium sp. 102 TaxID=2135623 RepID=UPI000EB063AE|nr:YtxH domain-containing protein [Flavobacterium sp. 102]RKS02763.1 YtxH-like protein [Flavobacterium sp. 102]